MMTSSALEIAVLPVIDQLGWTLIHFLWQGALLATVAAMLLRGLRKASPQTRYGALCVTMAIAAAMPLVTFLIVRSGAGSALVAGGDSLVEVIPASGDPTEVSPGAESIRAQTWKSTDQQFATGVDQHPSGQPGHRDAVGPVAGSADVRRLRAVIPWLVAMWSCGVVCLSFWHLAGWLLAHKLATRGTRPVAGGLLEQFRGLIIRMGIRHPVRLLQSTRVAVPIVVGWLRPVVLLPVSLVTGLPPDQVRAILAHELAHVRRHDFAVNILQSVVETCLFYHPAVWWLSRQIRVEREYCADADALSVCEDRDVYARALVSLAEQAIVPGPALAVTGGDFSARLIRILGITPGRERQVHEPAWMISAVLGLAVVGGLLGASRLNGAGDSDPGAVKESIEKAAQQLAKAPGWQLQSADQSPREVAEGYQGFRVVLHRTWKEYLNLPQQAGAAGLGPEVPFNLRHEDWEFVLIPDPSNNVPEKLKSKIRWRESNSPYYTRDIWLGRGQGFAWFTRGTLFGQEFLREMLKLQDGEDRIQLAMEGLQVKDQNGMTANSCMQTPAKFGDRALPYVENLVRGGTPGENLYYVIASVAPIQTPAATELLQRLYDWDDVEIRRGAEYALNHKPFRRGAKSAYLDMLSRQSSLEAACPAAMEYEWKEAIPLLRDVISSPRNLRYLKLAIPARRRLEGNPIPQELLDAEQVLMGANRPAIDPGSQQRLDAARTLLIESRDAEAANLIALFLAALRTKGSAKPLNDLGIEILRKRPRQSTRLFLTTIIAGLKENDSDRSQVQQVLNHVTDE